MKPVAAVLYIQNGQLKNEDALLIQENASLQIDYDVINPYAYQLPSRRILRASTIRSTWLLFREVYYPERIG